jgi:hypothetical protein
VIKLFLLSPFCTQISCTTANSFAFSGSINRNWEAGRPPSHASSGTSATEILWAILCTTAAAMLAFMQSSQQDTIPKLVLAVTLAASSGCTSILAYTKLCQCCCRGCVDSLSVQCILGMLALAVNMADLLYSNFTFPTKLEFRWGASLWMPLAWTTFALLALKAFVMLSLFATSILCTLVQNGSQFRLLCCFVCHSVAVMAFSVGLLGILGRVHPPSMIWAREAIMAAINSGITCACQLHA